MFATGPRAVSADDQDWLAVEWDEGGGEGDGDNAPHLDQNVLAGYVAVAPASILGLSDGLFSTAVRPPVSTRSPFGRKLVPRKSRLETKSENEARSALLARLWCHLILENPANRAENTTCLCRATTCQTGWRMGQFGAIRSRLETLKHRSEPASWPTRGNFATFATRSIGPKP